MQTTIRGKIFPSEDQAEKLDELMQFQSARMRCSYNRLYEDKSKSRIEADLKENSPESIPDTAGADTIEPSSTMSPL
ncbi:hypothetical protein AKJ42_01925 [candidate division MSBL1 archaeon SCGC-AAA261C02]|uniref:Uncharacterized protein n=1 Tax=candidate division MSBL1 archaeon SCGC-AAA261C02 TaxID=1698272 RepID=A0A133V0Q3_9EURY|nr:hypothetical protein AKJ42_01925 [candidate division MSBL1 archaeon SCGC-AAA261C02]